MKLLAINITKIITLIIILLLAGYFFFILNQLIYGFGFLLSGTLNIWLFHMKKIETDVQEEIILTHIARIVYVWIFIFLLLFISIENNTFKGIFFICKVILLLFLFLWIWHKLGKERMIKLKL
jgi:hypothetical protein